MRLLALVLVLGLLVVSANAQGDPSALFCDEGLGPSAPTTGLKLYLGFDQTNRMENYATGNSLQFGNGLLCSTTAADPGVVVSRPNLSGGANYNTDKNNQDKINCAAGERFSTSMNSPGFDTDFAPWARGFQGSDVFRSFEMYLTFTDVVNGEVTFSSTSIQTNIGFIGLNIQPTQIGFSGVTTKCPLTTPFVANQQSYISMLFRTRAVGNSIVVDLRQVLVGTQLFSCPDGVEKEIGSNPFTFDMENTGTGNIMLDEIVVSGDQTLQELDTSLALCLQQTTPPVEEPTGCCELVNKAERLPVEYACTTQSVCDMWEGSFTESDCKFDNQCGSERVCCQCLDDGFVNPTFITSYYDPLNSQFTKPELCETVCSSGTDCSTFTGLVDGDGVSLRMPSATCETQSCLVLEQPMGACCLRTDLSTLFGNNNVFQKRCMFLTEEDCVTNNGVYQGDDTLCPEASLIEDGNDQSSSCSCCQEGEVLLKGIQADVFEFTACVREGYVDDDQDVFDFYYPVCAADECAFQPAADGSVIEAPTGYDETCLYNKGGECGQPVQDCFVFPAYGACCRKFDAGFNLDFPVQQSTCNYRTQSRCEDTGGVYSGDGSFCPIEEYTAGGVTGFTRSCPCCDAGSTFGLIVNQEFQFLDTYCIDDRNSFVAADEAYVFVCDEGTCGLQLVDGDVADVVGAQATCAVAQGESCDQAEFPCVASEEFMGCCDLTESVVYQGTEPSACTTQAGCAAWGGVFNDQAECKFDSQCAPVSDCDTLVTCCVADEFGVITPQELSIRNCIDSSFVTVTLADQGMCPDDPESVANECCFEDQIITIDQSFSINDCNDNGGKIVEDAQACECSSTLQPPPSQLSCCECRCIDTTGPTPTAVTRWVTAEDCGVACTGCPSDIDDCTVEDATTGNFIDQSGVCFDTEEEGCRESLPTGACCVEDACLPDTTQVDCNELSGRWFVDTMCELDTCTAPSLQSYCCVCETSNNGGVETEPACVPDSPFIPNGQLCGSGELGTYSMCVPNDCTDDTQCATMPTPAPTPAPTPPPTPPPTPAPTPPPTPPPTPAPTPAPTPPPTPAPTPPPTPGTCNPEVEIVCNAALTGDCNVAGGQNLEDRLANMNDRLDQLENA